jgi:hypothetical protein
MGGSMSNAFGIGGLGWFFVPAPLATAARTAGNVKSTLDYSKSASSATGAQKALDGLQAANSARWIKRDLTNLGVLGRSKKKENFSKTRQTKGTGKGIIPMTPEEQKNEKNKSKRSLMNRFTGFFGKKNTETTNLPPITPTGEFAKVKVFSDIMKEFQIEGVTKENFIDKFIDGITEKCKGYKYISWVADSRKKLIEFEEQITKMTVPQIRNCTHKLFKLEKDIENHKILLSSFKKASEKKAPKLNTVQKKENKRVEEVEEVEVIDMNELNKQNIQNTENKIKKLENDKKRGEELVEGFKRFFLNFATDPLNKKNSKRRQKMLKDKFPDLQFKDEFFEIILFLSRNYYIFYGKIQEKIKELNQIITDNRENSIPAIERYMPRIYEIINDHNSFYNVLKGLFHTIIKTEKKTQEEKDIDIQKLIKMQVIIDNILKKNKLGYENMIIRFRRQRNYRGENSLDFTEMLKKYYQSFKNDETSRVKNKSTLTHRNKFYGGLKVDEMTTAATKEVDQNLDINTLIETLNNLTQELYKSYDIKVDVPKIETRVPPIILRKSLDYAKLLDKIYSYFGRSEDIEVNINILKLKLCIDEFMNRLGGSNYEKYKLEYDSKIMDKRFKKDIIDFNSKVEELKAEISKKNIEELKTEVNNLLDKFRNIFKDNKEKLEIGNITGLSNAANRRNNVSKIVAATPGPKTSNNPQTPGTPVQVNAANSGNKPSNNSATPGTPVQVNAAATPGSNTSNNAAATSGNPTSNNSAKRNIQGQ